MCFQNETKIFSGSTLTLFDDDKTISFCIANGAIYYPWNYLCVKACRQGIIFDTTINSMNIPEHLACLQENKKFLAEANNAIDNGQADRLLFILRKRPALVRYVKYSDNAAIHNAIEEHKQCLFAYFDKPYTPTACLN